MDASGVPPQGDALRSVYRLEFGSLDLPSSYRVTDNYPEANVVLANEGDDSNYDLQELRNVFVSQASWKAYRDSWWANTSLRLKELGADPEQADNFPIAAKHTLDIVVDGNRTGQGFDVFEVGEPEEDREAIATAFETLKIIDQFSGGLLAADPDRPSVILSNGIRLGQNREGGEYGGAAFPGGVVVNMPALKEMAREAGADFYALLSVVIVHEALGHGLERLVKGDSGRYFPEHFKYSYKRVPGEIFDDVHESVVARDALMAASSQPIREYGKTAPSEDFATSVDAAVAEVMGWDKGVAALPRFNSSPDAYRTELVLRLMQEAADIAKKYGYTPGIVGSEVRYVTGPDGNLAGVEPARKVEVTTVAGEQAVREEIDKMVAKYSPGSEFIVSPGDLV